jgi:predicted nucleic acid-binding protein
VTPRPPLERNVVSYEFDCPVPGHVVLDTSFVVRALSPAAVGHVSADQFIRRLDDAGTVVFFSRMLEVELQEVSYKIAVREQHGSRAWPAKRSDGRVRRRATRLADELFASWSALIATVESECVEIDDVADGIPMYMARYGLSSYDAIHAATVNVVGAAGLVSNDAGFGAVDERVLRLYTDSSRVRSARRRRRRGGR